MTKDKRARKTGLDIERALAENPGENKSVSPLEEGTGT